MFIALRGIPTNAWRPPRRRRRPGRLGRPRRRPLVLHLTKRPRPEPDSRWPPLDRHLQPCGRLRELTNGRQRRALTRSPHSSGDPCRRRSRLARYRALARHRGGLGTPQTPRPWVRLLAKERSVRQPQRRHVCPDDTCCCARSLFASQSFSSRAPAADPGTPPKDGRPQPRPRPGRP